MNKIEELKELIKEHAFIRFDQTSEEHPRIRNTWIFDFRMILMEPRASDIIAELFFEKLKDEYPFQLGTLEIAGVPLAVALMRKFHEKGYPEVSAFFVRKSRKKTGLLKMIDGQVHEDKKIILVDDVMNTGSSFWRQIEALDSLGFKIHSTWSILKYRDLPQYKRFTNRDISVHSLLTLNEMTETLGDDVKNLEVPTPHSFEIIFDREWIFKGKNPALGLVFQKSQPVIDGDLLYFGTDSRDFVALNKHTGEVAWTFEVGTVKHHKSVFSNPVIYKDLVIFGSYDGNTYALDKLTGKQKWVSMEADWVGSSPAVAPDLGLVFIGLEYGLITKMGGLLALNAETGKPVWVDRSHTALTHCSPHYIQKTKQVVIGSNDGTIRLHDAKTGKQPWSFTTFGSADYNLKTWVGEIGFSKGDVKESFAYDPVHDYIIFGSIDSFLYILDRKTGHLVHHFKCEFGILSTPYVYKNVVYFTSMDKRVRAIDLKTFELLFENRLDDTRIFSSPIIIKDKLYVGTNGGRLHELDLKTGTSLGYFQAAERITNNVIYDQAENAYYLPTYANEILKLKRKD